MSVVDFYLCPECGADVPVGSEGCGACALKKAAKHRGKKSGKKGAEKRKRSWEVDPSYDGLELPEDEFDYDDFVEREFGDQPHQKVGLAWYWWLTAVVLLVAMVWGFVF